MIRARSTPLIARKGARYTCFGDGLCCTDAHVVGPLSGDERARLESVRPGVVERHRLLRMFAVRVENGRCSFLGASGCSLHVERGAAFKPSVCRRFPYGLVSTPRGGRVTTEHRCPCRTLGDRPLLDLADAAGSLRDPRGRWLTSRRVIDIELREGTRVSFDDYVAIEETLLERLGRGDAIEEVLGVEPMPALENATWTDVAHLFRGYVDGSACGEALAWCGDALLAISDQTPRWMRRRPWSDSFDRAEARAGVPRTANDVLSDWMSDAIWDLEWTERGSFESAKRELATRLAMARHVVRALVSTGAREDRAAAEAVLIVELGGASALWPSVIATFAR